MLIVFEGIDGSGKSTQAKMLYEAITAVATRSGDGADCLLTKCPDYTGTVMGPHIKRYLEGGFGDLADNHPFLVSLLYAIDRYENRDELREWLCAGIDVVCDRYTYSNIAHQCAKNYGDRPWKPLAGEILHIEREVFGLPVPDKTIYLDISAEHSFARTHARAAWKDIHEEDCEYLDKVRKIYQWFAVRDKSWAVVPCFATGRERTVDEIHREICNNLDIPPLQK